MLSLDGTNFSPQDNDLSVESCRAIWGYFLEKIVRQGGPFAGYSSTENFERLLSTAVRLFPGGIPSRRQKWKVPDGVAPSEYGQFLKRVFVRTIPSPISDLDR